MKRKLFRSVLLTAMAFTMAGCGSSNKKASMKETQKKIAEKKEDVFKAKKRDQTEGMTYKDATHKTVGSPVVEMKVKNYGVIRLQLDSTYAPVTVANFVAHVKTKFYDGLTFQRLYKESFIQGGDPTESGEGSSKKFIKGEFTANKVKNPLNPDKGVIAMARATETQSDRSQFFISLADKQVEMYGQYATFGKVVSGMDVLEKIVKETPTNKNTGTIGQGSQPVIEYMKLVKEK